MGLLGGSLTALVISVLNVLPSFLVGLLVLRNLHHVRIWRRLVATLALFFSVGAFVSFNLLVAHFRIALLVDPDNALAIAVPMFVAAPFNIVGSFDAVSLCILGLFAGITAALDGYTLFDDRYPGYGRIDRRYRERLRLYESTKGAFRHDVERVVRTAHKEIDERLKKLQRKVDVARRVITTALACAATSQRKAEQSALACDRLLRTYREENQRIRTTPTPAYFDRYPVLETNLGVSVNNLHEKKEVMQEAVSHKMEEAARAKARVRHLAEQEIASLSTLVADVEKTAADNMDRGRLVPLLEAGEAA